MANGTYGTKKPALVTSDDIDIFYFYRPSYSSDSPDFTEFKKVETPGDWLYPAEGEYGENSIMDLPGMYNLRLPLDRFNEKGIYTIYIKPKEIFTKIVDADSRLAAYSDVRGIVLNKYIDGINTSNGNLVGYRVEYFEEGSTTERTGEYRIITSNNRCEPLRQNMNDSSQKGIRYRFNDETGDLVFCTVTPSTALSFKSNSAPSLGATDQWVALVNTKFNPVAIEIEMVDNDIESVTTMLEGTQLRNLDKGIITTFNKDGAIYHQADYGNIVNPNKNMHYDFKIPKTDNIDFTEEDKLKDIENNI